MRIAPLTEPYDATTAELLAAMMPPGIEPIALFRTFAHNPAMTAAMQPWGGYELSRSLSVPMRLREIVIDRTCARCGAEYEWGVHVAYFAERVGLDESQVRSLTAGVPDDPCWTDAAERAVIRLVDELHDTSTASDELWAELRRHFSDAQLLDLVALTGWYHTISFLARAAGVPLEEWAPRFADITAGGAADPTG